jgi:hypothetical protein
VSETKAVQSKDEEMCERLIAATGKRQSLKTQQRGYLVWKRTGRAAKCSPMQAHDMIRCEEGSWVRGERNGEKEVGEKEVREKEVGETEDEGGR